MTSEKKQPETGFQFSGCFCALFILFKHGQHIAITLRKRTRTPNLAVFALFAGVGRMRSGGSIQQKYRIFVAVSPLHRAAGGGAGTDKPAFVGTAVVKQYGAIIFGMNIWFHRLSFICYTITLNHSNTRLASRYIRFRTLFLQPASQNLPHAYASLCRKYWFRLPSDAERVGSQCPPYPFKTCLPSLFLKPP